jgi:glycosyltransferase involved in cell wall biosynthesis
LAADERLECVLLGQPKLFETLIVPPSIKVKVAPDFKTKKFGFLGVHGWEQCVLPVFARLWRCKVVWCNANYGPLLAPRPVPTLHTTTRAGAMWPGPGWRLYWGGLRALTWLLSVRAKVVCAVAGHVAAEYPRSGIVNKLVVAPPAVDVAAVEAYLFKQQTIVAVGDFYEQKNYPLMVQAMAVLHEKLPGVKLQIIGRPVWPQVVQAVQAEIQKHKLENVIEIIPGLPHAQTLARVAGAKVLLNTSGAECFNMPLLEAMALGTPVVCGDYDFQRGVVDNAAVLVPQHGGDVASALAVAVYGVLENPAIASALTKRGLIRASQFSWHTTGRLIADALMRAAGQ